MKLWLFKHSCVLLTGFFKRKSNSEGIISKRMKTQFYTHTKTNKQQQKHIICAIHDDVSMTKSSSIVAICTKTLLTVNDDSVKY